MTDMLDGFRMKNVEFRSRVFRSSMGGRTAYYDGVVTNAWRNFELRFARPEYKLGAIISATIAVDEDRLSPLEYPKITDCDEVLLPLAAGVAAVREQGCKYIMQIGDPGAHTQMSLFPQAADAMSSSAGFDFVYGYRNRSIEMRKRHIQAEIDKFAKAARLVKAIGCDGLEITASKGYLIHQFLNPGWNRRKDRYGGNARNRFRLLEEIVLAARAQIGADFLFGIRLSAKDYNWMPFNVRWPLWPLRDAIHGNGIEQTLAYGQRLQQLGVDYLHIDAGFGFLNPMGSPGKYPLEGVRLFANNTRHLSAKARWRAIALNAAPDCLAYAIAGWGWKYREPPSLAFAKRFKEETRLHVIANGGFQRRDQIHDAVQTCDAVAIARPLLANQDLLVQLEKANEPERKCSFCSLCCTRTAVQPLGCYDLGRYDRGDGEEKARARMQNEILALSADPT